MQFKFGSCTSAAASGRLPGAPPGNFWFTFAAFAVKQSAKLIEQRRG